MKSIEDILSINKKSYIKFSRVQYVCADIISKNTGVKIPASAIQYNNNMLTVLTSPIVKIEIHIQENIILKEMKENGIIISTIF